MLLSPTVLGNAGVQRSSRGRLQVRFPPLPGAALARHTRLVAATCLRPLFTPEPGAQGIQRARQQLCRSFLKDTALPLPLHCICTQSAYLARHTAK